jgi:hypothetical protein
MPSKLNQGLIYHSEYFQLLELILSIDVQHSILQTLELSLHHTQWGSLGKRPLFQAQRHIAVGLHIESTHVPTTILSYYLIAYFCRSLLPDTPEPTMSDLVQSFAKFDLTSAPILN